MKSLALSEYVKIIKPDYTYLKLTPNNSIRNYNSDKIAKAIGSLYQNLTSRIKKHNKKYFFEAPAKVAYYIYIDKQKVEFYFVVPTLHLGLIKEKIGDTWKGITITQVDNIPIFGQNAIKYTLSYKKEDALSLAADQRTNTLLSACLNTISLVEEGDRLGLFYNFVPASQYTWRSQYQNTINKIKNHYPVDRQKITPFYAIKMMVMLALDLINTCLEVAGCVLGAEDKKALAIMPPPKQLNQATIAKKDARVLKTQILVMAESLDKTRGQNIVLAACQAFDSIAADNELVYKPYKKKQLDLMAATLKGVDVVLTSPQECQNFIALPGRELLEEHSFIEKIDTHESEVPLELRKGVMCIGTNTYKGKKQKAYLTTDKEYQNLAQVIIGPTRSGKTTLIGNLSKDGVDAGECVIVFDFCGNCELSEEISRVVDRSKVLNIDCSKNLQGLGYNEVRSEHQDVFVAYRNAKIQTAQLLTLVNCINSANKELSAKMDRYLESAALVVFINNGPIKDVFATLQDHRTRKDYIKKVPVNQRENLAEYILNLGELDEVDKKTGEITGSRISAVAGIIDRINKLKQNPYMELMLKKGCQSNINLTKEIQKNQLICLRMPEVMFGTETEKDIYATYWLTKIWLALQIRKWEIPNRRKVNLIVDELYQIPNGQDFIRSKLSQMAKFNCKMIISCHYLGQIGIIRDELKAANASYMLISGCDKDNYKELKDELYPYELEDLLNLKRYHSLNLLKYEQGYARFITRLPWGK